MRVSITRAAATQVRKKFAGLGHVTAGVIIHRGPANADLKRGRRGEVIWDIERSWPWQVHIVPLDVVPLDDWPLELERAEANGIDFLLPAAEPHESRTFKVFVQDGKLSVILAA